MDGTTQAEELISTWMGVQRKMWESWLGVIQSGGAAQAPEAWGQAVESWKEAVERALEAQAAWIRLLADKVAAGAETPTAMATGPRQVLDMMQRWTEAQKPLWEDWFATLKRTDPSDLASTWRTEPQQVAQAWQEAAQKALETQQEWSRRWMAAVAEPLTPPPPQEPLTPPPPQ